MRPAGVVAAANYELRTFGVRSALPSVTAVRRCPDLVFVQPRFDVYRKVSQEIHAIFARYTDMISYNKWYYAAARGEDHRPINPHRVHKSSSLETTFDRDLTDPEEIEAGVLRMLHDVWRWCESRSRFGRTVTIKVEYATSSRSPAAAVKGGVATLKNLRSKGASQNLVVNVR